MKRERIALCSQCTQVVEIIWQCLEIPMIYIGSRATNHTLHHTLLHARP